MTILLPGQLQRDTYEIERLLGEGAFAEVYRVKHRFLGRQAMKVFKAAGITLKDVERDLEEALLVSSIKHPNIVDVYDANTVDTDRGRFGYFTMTYMSGGTLDRYWRSFGTQMMSVGEAVTIIEQVCRGLALAHNCNPPIVHRDIKPQNILIGFGSEGLHVRLSDFGLAKAVNPLTLLLSAKGTIGFKPPESLENIDSLTGDIWAMGTTLYLLLTDKMPFPDLDDRDNGDANRFLRPIRPPSMYNINVDADLESIIFRCLSSVPTDRYSKASDLLVDLERWRGGLRLHCTSVCQPKSLMTKSVPEDLKQQASSAVQKAFQVAQDPTKLMSAADLIEEAICKDPDLRERFEPQLQLWRKGIMHVSISGSGRFTVPMRDGKTIISKD